MKKILVIGPTTLDFVSHVDSFPKGNEEMNFEPQYNRLSGTGWNCAKLLKPFDLSYHLISSVGSGIYGDMVKEASIKEEIPLMEYEGIHGCTYTMVDQEGNYRYMIIPGIEYIFPYDAIESLDLDDYDTFVFSGDIFEELSDELIYLIESFEGELVFIPGSRVVMLEKELLAYLYSFHPTIVLSQEELLSLTDHIYQDVISSAQLYAQKTQAKIFVSTLEGELLYLDKENEIILPNESKKSIDLSGVTDAIGASYILGNKLGLSLRDTLKVCAHSASMIAASENTTLNTQEEKELKDSIASLILHS